MIDLRMTDSMRELIEHPARFKVDTEGRRSGKTYKMAAWLHAGEMQPGERRWYVAPYRKQAKQIMWPLVKHIARAYGVGPKAISESELAVRYPNGAEIQLHGADNPDGLVGVGLSRLGCDEYALWQKPDVWEAILRPMLTQSKGPVLFASTPRGRNHHYDLHLKGQDPAEPEWASWLHMTKDSPFVDPAEVEAARRDMDPILFAQEYEASFDTGGDRCAWNFQHTLHVRDLERPRTDQSWIGLDFNVSPMIAEIGGYTVHEGRRVIYYYDEVVIPSDAHTDMMCRILSERFPGVRIVYPDPTGKAGHTASIKSDHRILHDNGFTVRAHPPGRPSQRERMAAWNRMLLDGEGKVHMFFSPKCRELIKDQDKAERHADGSINKRTHDPHAFDAAGYAVEYQHPIQYRNVQVRRSA